MAVDLLLLLRAGAILRAIIGRLLLSDVIGLALLFFGHDRLLLGGWVTQLRGAIVMPPVAAY
jgi:hypothetical protein